MPRPLPRDRWLAEAADRFASLDAWRQAHPKATWAEIETASDATDLRGERPVCPDCGARLAPAGPRRRTLRGEQDVALDLERTYARCPTCGRGLFPPR
jgi:uncharacterized protein with PIN domain